MNHVVPQQHPAVVLRSHYVHLRALLAVLMFAVAGLTVAVVILANEDTRDVQRAAVQPATVAPASTATVSPSPGIRYDGGPDEGTRGIVATRSSSPGVRYDGGPEEGTRGLATRSSAPAPAARYDGGPEEGTRGITTGSQSAPQRLGASRPEPAFR